MDFECAFRDLPIYPPARTAIDALHLCLFIAVTKVTFKELSRTSVLANIQLAPPCALI